MQENEKNIWIDRAMQSLEGIDRPEPKPGLFDKITLLSKTVVVRGRIISLKTVSVAAACLLILITLNVVILSRERSTNNDIKTVANYYQLTSNDLYSNL